MASKKRKTGKATGRVRSSKKSKEFKKRSKAARRGWETRRKNALIAEAHKKQKQLKNAQLGVSKSKRQVITELDVSDATKEELLEIIESQKEQLEVLTLTKNWVNAMPDEYIRLDGTVALEPSHARHVDNVDVYWQLLDDANTKGDLDHMANFLAGELDLPIREIYTLYFSP